MQSRVNRLTVQPLCIWSGIIVGVFVPLTQMLRCIVVSLYLDLNSTSSVLLRFKNNLQALIHSTTSCWQLPLYPSGMAFKMYILFHSIKKKIKESLTGILTWIRTLLNIFLWSLSVHVLRSYYVKNQTAFLYIVFV